MINCIVGLQASKVGTCEISANEYKTKWDICDYMCIYIHTICNVPQISQEMWQAGFSNGGEKHVEIGSNI